MGVTVGEFESSNQFLRFHPDVVLINAEFFAYDAATVQEASSAGLTGAANHAPLLASRVPANASADAQVQDRHLCSVRWSCLSLARTGSITSCCHTGTCGWLLRATCRCPACIVLNLLSASDVVPRLSSYWRRPRAIVPVGPCKARPPPITCLSLQRRTTTSSSTSHRMWSACLGMRPRGSLSCTSRPPTYPSQVCAR